MNDLPHELHRELQEVEALRADLLKLTDDEDAIRDTIEGASSIQDMIGQMLASIGQDDALCDGIAAFIKDLQARRSRIEQRIEAKRALVERSMVAASLPKLETPAGTAFLSQRKPQARITSEADIPARFWVQPAPPAPKLDRAALAEALRAGETVPGAELDNGSVSLTVRVK